jgi:peroxiredoxin
MKRTLTTLLLLMLVTASSLGLAARTAITHIKEKPEAPGFILKDMDGNKYSQDSFAGMPVIINFWATWCPPCRAELPAMNRAWAKVKDKGVAMIAVNVGEDEDTIFSFQADYPIDFTILLDQDGKTIKRWPVRGLPTTFVLDPQGRLVYRAVGGRDWDDDALLQKVLDLRIKPEE